MRARRPASVAGFEWDEANRDKCQIHGVSIREIESVFETPVAVLPDPAHSEAEQRFKAIGVTTGGRHVFVVFTLRSRGVDSLIRPISARFMHRKEIEYYEKTAARPENR
jgi:hypothetical protein